MVVEYRLARPNDEPLLLDLWVEANPGTERAAWQRDFERIPGRWERTRIGVAPTGEVISAALYWPREVRGVSGKPMKVGAVSHVATHPIARREGHARRLMEQTIHAMREEGCVWSYLTATEASRALYKQLQWRSYPRRVWQGLVAGSAVEKAAETLVLTAAPGDMEERWAALAAVYQAANGTRPLTVARDERYWRHIFGPRLNEWQNGQAPTIFIAHRSKPDRALAYLIVYFSDEASARELGLDRMFTISELCVRPGDTEAVPTLLRAAATRAGGARLAGRLYAPREPDLDAVIQQWFGESAHTVEDVEPMARPIAPGFERDELDALFAAPGALFWPLDEV